MKTHFQQAVLTWFKQHGRKTLPWQNPATPYRVWVSEIMLQQTQVSTVIAYFERFMARFPNLETLANAPLDAVLQLWAGLGYYARARNLHRSAQIIIQEYGGEFPADLTQLISLPGIGRSTAGAILSLGFKKSAAILDGNVKRVLARVFAIPGWPGTPSVLKQLWEIAETYSPQHSIADYNQAMMDLGALVCLPKQPRCSPCPLQTVCLAYQQNQVTTYPSSKPKKTIPVRATHLLIFQNQNGEVLLEQRPPVGIWGGLWSFPECQPQAALESDFKTWTQNNFNLQINKTKLLPAFRHTFSHYHLDITPVLVHCQTLSGKIMESRAQLWHDPREAVRPGIPAPVQQLFDQLWKP